MKLAACTALILGIAVFAADSRAADAIQPGQWEFSTQLQAAGMRQPAPGGMEVNHKQCVEPDKAVPSDPRRECKVDKMERKANVITWSTTCKGAQGEVESAGTARYSGNTMQANLNVRAPNGSGGFIETKQHITGRYLGPCPN